MTDECFTVDGNRLTLLEDGRERLATLIRLLDEARKSIRMIFYIYADDVSGRRVNAALIAAARRGVSVRLIVDGFGSDATPSDFFDAVEAAGVSVCRFSARFGRRYLLRNHQKLVLVDAEADPRIIVGGFNVEDDYFGTGAGSWRDLGLLVAGPAAGRLAEYFDGLDEWVRNPK